jgi:hypothetical protein
LEVRSIVAALEPDLSTIGGSREVFVLGAGFSRALSDRMPLTDELGNLCLDDQRPHLGAHDLPDQFTGGSFETWLSRLADEEPYLTAEENLQDQALFLRFSGAIARVLGERVHHVLGVGWPAWFPEFLRVAHQRRATLVTFNYDPLIECGVGTGLLQEPGRAEPVYWAEVIGDVPNWPPGPARIGAERVETFRLLKLHGSLNWYWSPGDDTGISLARRDLPGVYARPEQYTEEDRQRELPGRVPFVVPPSATKSPYYRNPVMREVWRQASVALAAADRIIITGYSLPPADLTVASMLANALSASNASVIIVDLHPEPVAKRLHRLGIASDRIRTVAASDPIADLVAAWRDETGRRLLYELGSSSDEDLDSPLLVYWHREAVASVEAVQLSDDGAAVELITGEAGSLHVATQARKPRGLPDLPVLRDVLKHLHDRLLTARTSGGTQHTMIGRTDTRLTVGHGSGRWTVMIPSGPPDIPSR